MKKYVFIVLLGFIATSNAQNFKFGKVSKKELEEKTHPIDKDAHAAVLYKNQQIHYVYDDRDGFVQRTEVTERIKIYTKEGFDWATKEVRLYDKNNSTEEDFREFSAYTYTLENGKIEKTKIKKESIFEEKNNKFWATKKFVMPNVKEGCVIEYKYTVSSPFKRIKEVDLQYTIPINVLEFTAKIPEFFIFQKYTNPKAFYMPKLVENVIRRTEKIVNKTKASYKSNNREFTPGKVTLSEWVFKEEVITINDTNIPALKAEPLVRDLGNYRAKLIWEYAAYKGPDNIFKNYSTTWEEVTSTIMDNPDFGGELEKKSYFEADIDALLTNVVKPEEKASKIYDFVKLKMKKNGLIGYYADQGVKRAYKEGVGNVAEINLMLTAMLRHAGLNANPVILSTRNNGIPLFPNTEGFNYVIAAIEYEDGTVTLLDATNENSTANVLPESAINWQGRIIRKDGSSDWIRLNPDKVSKEMVMLNYTISKELEIEGKITKRLTDYLALDYRDLNKGSSDEARIRKLEEGKGDIEIFNLKVKDENETNKPITYNYDFKLKNRVDEIDDKLYLSPLLFLNLEENAFKQEERVYPIDFIYPVLNKYFINLELPEGYRLESKPENKKIQLNSTEGEFTYIMLEKGNKLQLTVEFKLNKTFIVPAQYTQFKEFFALSFEKKSQQIVLVKKQ